MKTNSIVLPLCMMAFISCRKESNNTDLGDPVPTVLQVNFDRHFPGALHSSWQCTDGTFLALMDVASPYSTRQLVKVDSAGGLVAEFAPAWPVGVVQGPAAPTDNGGCLSVAYDYEHLIIARMDASGAVISSRNYDFPGSGTPRSIMRTSTSTWIVSGHHQFNVTIDSISHTVQDFWVMAVDVDGDSLWKRTYSDPHVRWITSSIGLSNGDALITSYFGSISGSQLNAVRLNQQGELLWNRDIGPIGGYGHGVCEAPNGDLVFAGGVSAGPYNLNGVLYATNSGGALLWQHSFGSNGMHEWVKDVAIDGFDRIVVVGHTSPITGNDEDRLYAAGFDVSGNMVWERYSADNDTMSYGLKVFRTSPGRFATLGRGNPNVNGTIQWFSFLKGISSGGEFE